MPRVRAEGARDRILDAASPLFYLRGIQAVGVADVAAAAGCSKNLLYREFPSKEHLVVAHLERLARWRAKQDAAAVAPVAGDPVAEVVALTELIAAQAGRPDFRGCPFRNYRKELPDADGPSVALADRWLADERSRLSQRVRATGVADAEGATAAVWLVWDGMWASSVHPDPAQVAGAGVRLVERALAT